MVTTKHLYKSILLIPQDIIPQAMQVILMRTAT